MAREQGTRRGYMVGIGGVLAGATLIRDVEGKSPNDSRSIHQPSQGSTEGSVEDFKIVIGGVGNRKQINEDSSPGRIYHSDFEQGETLRTIITFDGSPSSVFLSYGVQDSHNYYEVEVRLGDLVRISKVIEGNHQVIVETELLDTEQEQLELSLIWDDNGTHEAIVHNSLFYEKAVGSDEEWKSGDIGLACEQNGILHWISKNRPVLTPVGRRNNQTLADKIRAKAKKEGPVTQVKFESNIMKITFGEENKYIIEHELKESSILFEDWEGKKFVFRKVDLAQDVSDKFTNLYADRMITGGK